MRIHIHMLIWNFGGHAFLDAVPYFMLVFFLLERPKDLDQTAQMHRYAHAELELCWSGVSLASLYVSFKVCHLFCFVFVLFCFVLFCFVFAKVLTDPYITRLSVAKTQIKLRGYSLHRTLKHL